MAVNLSPVGGVAAQFFDNNGNVLSGGKLFTYAAGTTTPAVTYTSSLGNTPQPNPIVLDAAGRVPASGEIWLTDGVIYKFVLQTSTNVLIATYDNITGINSNFVNFTAEQEIQTATAGQTVFNLSTMQYQPGTNSLSVYVDGVNQYGPGAQYAYVETDSDTVTFVSGLHVGASVKFTTATQVTGNATDASVVSYTPPFTGGVTTNVEDKLAQYVSVKDFGAVGDGVTDDTAALNAAFAIPYTNVLVTEGTYVTSDIVFVAEGCTITFSGTIKLMDGLTNPPIAVLRVNKNNVTLVNPLLDGNRDNVTDPGGIGTHTVLAVYGLGGQPNVNFKMYGGILQNGIHNILQGTSQGMIVDGTRMAFSGEHTVYINETDGAGGTLGTLVTFLNCRLDSPALHLPFIQGDYFKIVNSGDAYIDNCVCKNAGSASTSNPTIGIDHELSGKLIVTNSKFFDLTNKFIYKNSGDAIISNCVIEKHPSISSGELQFCTGVSSIAYNNTQISGLYAGGLNEPAYFSVSNCEINSDYFWSIGCNFLMSECIFTTDYTVVFQITDGNSKIVDNTFRTTGGPSLTVQTDGSALISGNDFPDLIGGSFNLVVDTTGHAIIVNNSFPLADSAQTIVISATTVNKTIVGGNYLPDGNINDASGVAVLYGNVKL